MKPQSFPAMAAVICLCVSGCGVRPEAPVGATGVNQASDSSIVTVTTIRPQRKALRRATTQPGQVEPFEEAPIYSRVAGYVERVLVDIGDRVTGPQYDADGSQTEPGQPLAQLAVPELRDAMRQKQAALDQAEAQIQQSAAAVQVAEAAARAAQAGSRQAEATIQRAAAQLERWRLENDRIEKLAANMAVTQKVADETRNQWKAAEAAKLEADAGLEAARAAVTEAEAGVVKSRSDEQAARAARRVAEADLRQAATMVEFATLRAPFDGVVTQRSVDPGHFVQPAASGSKPPLLVITNANQVRLFIDVPETEASLVNPGDAAEIVIGAHSEEPIRAKVTRTSWRLDSTARTLRTEIDIPNPEGALRPGMYVQATVVLDERAGVLAVPSVAVLAAGGERSCVVVRDNRAVHVPVVVGLQSGAEVEIVSGLSGEEMIVAAGAAGLADGQVVTVAETAAPQ